MAIQGYGKDVLRREIDSAINLMETVESVQSDVNPEDRSSLVQLIADKVALLRNEVLNGQHGDQLFITQISSLERRLRVMNSAAGSPLGELSARTATTAALPTRMPGASSPVSTPLSSPALMRTTTTVASSSLMPSASTFASASISASVFGSRNQYQEMEFEVYRTPAHRNSSCTAHAAAFGLRRLLESDTQLTAESIDEILLNGHLAAATILNQYEASAFQHLAFFEDLKGEGSPFRDLVSAIPVHAEFGVGGVTYEGGSKIIQLAIPTTGKAFYYRFIERMILMAQDQGQQELFVLMTAQGASHGLFLKRMGTQLVIEIFDSHGQKDLNGGRGEAFVTSFTSIESAATFLNRLCPPQDFGDDQGWQIEGFNQIKFYPLVLNRSQLSSVSAIPAVHVDTFSAGLSSQQISSSSSSSSYSEPRILIPTHLQGIPSSSPAPQPVYAPVDSMSASMASMSLSGGLPVFAEPVMSEITLDDQFTSLLMTLEDAIESGSRVSRGEIQQIRSLVSKLKHPNDALGRLRREIYKYVAIANHKMQPDSQSLIKKDALTWARNHYFDVEQLPCLLNAVKSVRDKILSGNLQF